MNLCFVCNEYPPAPHGGLGTFVRDVARRCAARGHSVIVVGFHTDVKTTQEEDDEGVSVLRYPIPDSTGALSFFATRLRAARALQRLIKTKHLDIVEAAEGGGWTMFLKATAPLVVRLHSSTPYFAMQEGRSRGKALTLAENIALRRAHRVLAVSRFIAKQAPALYPKARLEGRDIPVIYNGINTELFVPSPYAKRNPHEVVFAGTLKPIEGVDKLLAAFAQVASHIQAHLTLYGKDTLYQGGSYREHLLKPYHHLLHRIHYKSALPVSQMSSAYAAASVCVFPSLAESFGLVAAEAMSCARPVVYSNRTAGPELITHQETGWLCDPENPEAIAEGIYSLLSQPQQAERIGENAVEAVRKHFTLERCVEETLQFYAHLV